MTYFVENGQVKKYNALAGNVPVASPIPQSTQTYIGNQVLLNSDRLVFNAKTDGIFLFADRNIGFSTNGNFNLDGGPGSTFTLNTSKVYVGLDGTALPHQPAVLGVELLQTFADIIELFKILESAILYGTKYTVLPDGTTTMNVKNEDSYVDFRDNLSIIENNLFLLLSEKVFIAK